jgi:murein tripeptide amidase MpaA
VANLAKEVKFSEEIMLLSYSSKSTQYTREITFDCRETKFRHCESLKRFWSINFSYTFEAG